jgi:TRAP-type mannitol/chloroaromatic compound transport system substrate-binding protein
MERLRRAGLCLLMVGSAGLASSATAAAAGQPVQWDMASLVPSTIVQLGTSGKRFVDTVAAISGGTVAITFHEPGALVPPSELFNVVAKGAVDAGWGTAGAWRAQSAAAPLFSAIPFGPSADEYLAWIYDGGGRELWQEILARHNIHGVFCSMHGAEASGWFREEIRTLDDLDGLKMRFFGLGAVVMEKLVGTIDAAELSMPAVDLSAGIHRIAKYYYFPGWHQPV